MREGRADELREVGDGAGFGAAQPGAEIVPESDAELGAGFGKAEEGIAAIASEIAAGATANLALGDLAADGVFGAVGVQRNFRPVESHQQLGFVGMDPREQSIEGGKTGLSLEDAVETGAQGGSALRRRIATIGLEIRIEPQISARTRCCAARWLSVKVSSLWTKRSAWTQHKA